MTLEVTQEDRDVAAAYGRAGGIFTRVESAAILNGHHDDCTAVQHFAAHRQAAERRVVEWLLSEEAGWPEVAGDIADAIERGEHRK